MQGLIVPGEGPLPNGPMLDERGVRLGFHMMLRRPPESAEVVAHYLSLGLTLPDFLAVLMESDEFMERQRRILLRADLALDAARPAARAGSRALLFGAFGNGNVGDLAQLAGVAALLRGMAPRAAPPILAASSWERLAPFAAHGIETLRPDALMRPEHIRPRSGPDDGGGADLVVIGGGGLFGAPHFPLHERRWAEWFVRRDVPFVLLGVGGSELALETPGWREAYALLLEHAAFVGLRDEETLTAARRIRPEAAWFPDPVLAAAMLAEPRAPLGASSPARDLDALLIPRAPNGAADQAALTGLLELSRQARAAGQRVVIAALEKATDRPALTGEDVVYVATWDELLALCGRAQWVLSARLHGVIAGLASGCAVRGLSQPKTGDLLRRLGLAEWFDASGWSERPASLSAEAARTFHAAASPGLTAFRAAAATARRRAARAIEPPLSRWATSGSMTSA